MAARCWSTIDPPTSWCSTPRPRSWWHEAGGSADDLTRKPSPGLPWATLSQGERVGGGIPLEPSPPGGGWTERQRGTGEGLSARDPTGRRNGQAEAETREVRTMGILNGMTRRKFMKAAAGGCWGGGGQQPVPAGAGARIAGPSRRQVQQYRADLFPGFQLAARAAVAVGPFPARGRGQHRQPRAL